MKLGKSSIEMLPEVLLIVQAVLRCIVLASFKLRPDSSLKKGPAGLKKLIAAGLRKGSGWHYFGKRNIMTENKVYPELIRDKAWFGKIGDILAEWYVKPDTRVTRHH